MDSFRTRSTLNVNGKPYTWYSIAKLAEHFGEGRALRIAQLPISIKVLLENLLRHEDGETVTADDIRTFLTWADTQRLTHEIAYRPARVLMQDFTGVPGVADLAAMRAAVADAGLDPAIVNPLVPVDLVIDHSVMVDASASADAFEKNVEIEMARNGERYRFLRWGQQAFKNFKVVPPGTGICHQVNLEYLARVVWTNDDSGDGNAVAYPDTLVGTDSHTTMINGLGVLGWGVGGIEAEAAMLGQPISMLVPEVVGFRFDGRLREGITATDLVLKVVEMLRQHGVVGKFVEFFGDGLASLPLAERATIANMAPEYGATCGIFPIDDETLAYLRLSGRSDEQVDLVEAYAKAQGLWRDDVEPVFTDTLVLDLDTVEASLAGPKRPQDRVSLSRVGSAFNEALELTPSAGADRRTQVSGTSYSLGHGDVVIAAITSCTNTSNPAVMLGAGLVARKAAARGLAVKPWVKTSLAPGSKVVTEYLQRTGLQDDLDALGFQLVGYGCTTCIGNSGPLPKNISAAIQEGDLVVASVLSGNRNFEGRVHQEVRTNWLASPPLVVAYALAGSVRINFDSEPIGTDEQGAPVFLRDIWPSNEEIADAVASVSADMFERQYRDVFSGEHAWQAIQVEPSQTYGWEASSYIRRPPFFSVDGQTSRELEVTGARILALFGDSVTTDHISPAGAIQAASPAGEYLQQQAVVEEDFNSYGARRGNHEVMMRGTFANIRIRNRMVSDVEGGYTRHIPTGDTLSIYDAAMRYGGEGTPLVVIAGKEYGTGSSRDWAAKGTRLLGVRAVLAESFERIHRFNLMGMGILPIEFVEGMSAESLSITGEELIDISLPPGVVSAQPRQKLVLTIRRPTGEAEQIDVHSRLDTSKDIRYFESGGILQYVLNDIVAKAA